jgi:hypothetical protein
VHSDLGDCGLGVGCDLCAVIVFFVCGFWFWFVVFGLWLVVCGLWLVCGVAVIVIVMLESGCSGCCGCCGCDRDCNCKL